MDPKPLRLLVIVNLPWDARLGACRVWMELAAQWRLLGHTVEKFSLSDAFPGVRATRVTFALRQWLFIRKAAAFVRQNGERFDLIDALIGTLPFCKHELGFRGVIVARSVGLYRFYDRFDQTVGERWPRPRRGKMAGRWLYRFARRRLLRAADLAIQHADLINLPNEREADCLRAEINPSAPIIVQPYGCNSAPIAPPERRSREPRISFIGMWSPRKGARDWPRIIAQVRAEIPAARFCFLGTMTEEKTVRADLGSIAADAVDFISSFAPSELPALLADCRAGAFPSYVEGFGLAVLEQLAAGIPTVAYDIPGPHDILAKDLPELLVPTGDVDAFAEALVRILRLDDEAFTQLSAKCHATAAEFSWPEIARSTLQTYRKLLDQSARPIVFLQPFSIGSAGGGARILRALLAHAPCAWKSVCSSPVKPKPWPNELHLRARPSWGRVEHSRLAAWPNASSPFFARGFRRRLQRLCVRLGARAIHAVPHAGLDFAEAHLVARALALPFFISLHDDLAYTALVRPKRREAAMATAWGEAAGRFVITEALGREYCRRYGQQEFQVVTDGVEQLTPPRPIAETRVLRIYFMGLFHMAYEHNLRVLLDAISLLASRANSPKFELTLRCEHIRPSVLAGASAVRVLPFADEMQVAQDLEHADLLYMPIPFGEEHGNFARYSLSTKMVTYAGSGVPILYHGPTTSAAFALLQTARAALVLDSLEPAEIAQKLNNFRPEQRATAAANALALAGRDFMLRDQVEKFWGTIAPRLTSVRA
ncbi:MAG: glycosyltransferase family 4 protein [Chthoniobacterales bacterium]